MKTIMVTGANKGIGFAIVEGILKQQETCAVMLGSRNLENGQEAVAQLLSKNQAWANRLSAVHIDVSSADAVAKAAESAAQLLRQQSGELIGLVNNAGIAQGTRADMLAVNVYGIKHVLEKFKGLMSPSGRMVNVTSASGPNYVADCATEWQDFFLDKNAEWPRLEKFMQDCIALSDKEMLAKGLPVGYDYGLSKACANLLTLVAAREHSELHINACTPGYIDTDLTRAMLGGSTRPASELGMKTPVDGARVVMRLLFDASATSGFYYGSDAERSPMDRYRAPGSPPYMGD